MEGHTVEHGPSTYDFHHAMFVALLTRGQVHDRNGSNVLDLRRHEFRGCRRTIPEPVQRTPEPLDRVEHDSWLDLTNLYITPQIQHARPTLTTPI